MDTILEISDFSHSYNNIPAVENLTLHVDSGEIFGFIGHNGAGKSTTIKAIVGILPVKKGSITIDGLSAEKEGGAYRALCAYVPDNPDLYGYMTGIGYINFIADLYGVPSDLRTERIKRYAEAFEILPQLGGLISSYSHGMKQKVSLIAAFVHAPRLLVLDEPFVGLDPKASAVLKDCMHEFCRGGSAVFFSTHVLDVAERLCDRIAMIDNGRLVITGKTAELTKEKTLEQVFLENLKRGESENA